MSAESYSGASVAAFFDQYGRREWERLDRDARGRLIHSLHEHFLEGSLRVDVRVLDAGCGAGRFALQCARAGARLTLLDISPTQLELARTQLADSGARVEDAIVADIADLTMLASGQFDLTLCYGSVLSYLVDEGERGLSELVRVTRPGGRVVLSVGSRLGLFRFAAGRPGLDAAGFFGRPEHWLIDRVLETGTLPVHPEVEHPARHFYTSEELRGLMTRCGLVELELATAPALTGGMFERLTEIESSAPAWATLRSLEERCYREPGLLDAGDFILARGTVRRPLSSSVQAPERHRRLTAPRGGRDPETRRHAPGRRGPALEYMSCMLTERASLAVMALAKRSSRPFELDGVCYRWRVVTHGLMGSHVVIAPEQSPCRRVRTWITDGSWIPNGNQITPGHIRELLVTARKRGWSPRGPGPDALVLDHVSPTLESFINVVSQDTPEEAFDYSYARAAVGLTPWPDPDRLVLVLRCKAGHLRTSAMPIERCIEQLDVACQRLHNRMPATLVGVEPRPSIWLTSDGAQLQFGVDDGPRVGSLRILSSGVLGWWEYVADQLRSVATRLRASAEAAAHTG